MALKTARLIAAAVMGAASLAAQGFLNPITTSGVEQSGIRLYNFSVYTGYSTVDRRYGAFLQSLTGNPNSTPPRYSTASGATLAIGLHEGGEQSNFSLIYSPSFSYTTYGQSWNSMTHTVALNWARKLAPRWQFSLSGSGVTGNFDQLLFTPNGAQGLAGAAGTAEQLGGTILTGQGGSASQNAAAGAAATIAPQQRLLYGDRMLSASMDVSLAYLHSTRTSVGITFSGNRMQHLRDSNAPTGQNYYVVPQTTNGAAAISYSYLLTPRTTFTASASYGRSFSALNQSQYTSTRAGFGRKLTPRWFAQFNAGGGYILPVGHISTNARGKQWESSGSLGFRGRRFTLVGNANRAIADFYGVGAAATLSTSLGMSWQNPGSNWAFQAGGGQDRLLGNQTASSGLGNDGYRADAGVIWTTRRHATVALQYAYVQYTGLFPTTANGALAAGQRLKYAQHAVRLNFGWGTGPGFNTGMSGADAAPR